MKWATITSVDPLRVRLDGETDPLPLAPDALISEVAVGDRVRCELSSGRVIVHGRAGGLQPMRLSFPTKTDLDAFTGWPGLIGYVVATNTEYLWTTSWRLWSRPWANYTPTVTNLTLGDGTITARYCVAAGTVIVEGRISFGSTTSVGGIFHISAPLPFPNNGVVHGVASAFDTSATRWYLGGWIPGAYFYFQDNVRATATAPITWANGDSIRFQMMYEATP